MTLVCALVLFVASFDLLFRRFFFLSTFPIIMKRIQRLVHKTLNFDFFLDKNFCWGIASKNERAENHVTADDDAKREKSRFDRTVLSSRQRTNDGRRSRQAQKARQEAREGLFDETVRPGKNGAENGRTTSNGS